MFSKPYYRHLPNLGRAALLIFALVASSTVLVWNQWPELVHDLDYVIVKAYRTGTETAWNEARVPTHDRARRIELLEELLGDLESIRKGDRLGPIKRGALDRLTAELQAQGDHARGIEWAERWVAFDDRDINGQVRLARLLYRAGERRDEGIHILGELQRRFPGEESISQAYIGMLIEQARHTEACGILLDYLRAGAPDSLSAIQDWEVFWDVGEGFSPRTRKPVVGELGGDGTFELTFAIPPDSRRVRIDPPPLRWLSCMNFLVAAGPCFSSLMPTRLRGRGGRRFEQRAPALGRGYVLPCRSGTSPRSARGNAGRGTRRSHGE